MTATSLSVRPGPVLRESYLTLPASDLAWAPAGEAAGGGGAKQDELIITNDGNSWQITFEAMVLINPYQGIERSIYNSESVAYAGGSG